MIDNNKDNLIFGLDIGTRTIIGIVGYKLDENFIVVASEIVEHESRAMIDGQIHDILAVARIAQKVKENLESKIGHPLNEVAIAAAGRVLKTVQINVTQEFEENQLIDGFIVKSLELKGIKKAEEQIKQSYDTKEDSDYFFVGHSVIRYYLNGYVIANLEEQKGKQIGADIIATFLPKMVVESLYTVMNKIGLKVTNMTLEPIAAMNTVIPVNLRMLNLALVDIGAGTSDIAITKEGSVVAYGMIPMAGDEITEKIVHKYLVDFDTAEDIKQQLSKNDQVNFTDIIGIEHSISSDDVFEYLKDTVDQLTAKIASKIIELNGNKSPNAVFCVGGGSQTPYLIESVCKELSLPVERVSIRGTENAFMIVDKTNSLHGPESITPLGICVTTMEKRENDFISIKVNGKIIKLLHTKQLTIADAIIEAGIDYTKIISVRGKTLMFKLNGDRVRVKGGIGTQPKILKNNKEATLETSVSEGDELVIHPAKNGEDGHATILDMVKKLKLDKDNIIILANGNEADINYVIKNGDDIVIEIKQEQVKEEIKEQIFVTVNGEVVALPYKENILIVTIFDYIDFDLSTPKGNIVLELNGKRASYDETIKNGDKIDIYWD